MKLGTGAFSFIVALGIFAFPMPSDEQQPARVYHIGYLVGAVGPPLSDRTPQGCPPQGKGSSLWQALLEGLRERGYAQGQNLVIECRWTEGREERTPALAAELVSLKVDVLLVFSTASVRAAKQVTSTIPIVMLGVIDPAGRGLVASLARPAGNVTGVADDAGTEMAGRLLQLVKETVPRVSRVAVLGYENVPPETIYQSALEAAARALNVTLLVHELREPEKLEGAFAAMNKERAEALLVLQHPFMWTHRQRIVDLAAQGRLPAVYAERDFVKAGGLLSYGVDLLAVRRRVGFYVDKILKGARPSDLPVEQPTKFELVINLGTAKALGLTIPQSVLLRADEVVQ
ncbi:MAG TPA: ABC transporter substrate-binding protein [Gammaproteobacteria bacterium]|nr:ABC transporter substrate-binding protein [Gammaproteobacteria bacterium]